MSYEMGFDEARGPFIELENAPSFHHVLKARYLKDEDSLQQGAWFVVLLVPYSPTSKINLEYMRKAANKFEGFIQFGMRVFEDNDEMAQWCPEANLGLADPITAIVLDGKLLWKTAGVVSWGQIQQAAGEFLYDHVEKAYQESGRKEPLPWFSADWPMYVAYLAVAYFFFWFFSLNGWKYGEMAVLLLCPLGVWLDFGVTVSDHELDARGKAVLFMKRSIVGLALAAPMIISFCKQWL